MQIILIHYFDRILISSEIHIYRWDAKKCIIELARKISCRTNRGQYFRDWIVSRKKWEKHRDTATLLRTEHVKVYLFEQKKLGMISIIFCIAEFHVGDHDVLLKKIRGECRKKTSIHSRLIISMHEEEQYIPFDRCM